MGISQQLIAAELAAIENVQIERSNNRSVLGSMTDFGHNLRFQVGEKFDFSQADELEDFLAEMPMAAA
jgi:hypothetical protein